MSVITWESSGGDGEGGCPSLWSLEQGLAGHVDHPYSHLPGRWAVAWNKSAIHKLVWPWKLCGLWNYSWYFKPTLLPPWCVLGELVSPSHISIIICEMVSFFPEEDG